MLQDKNTLTPTPLTEQKYLHTNSSYRTKTPSQNLHLQNENALSLSPSTKQKHPLRISTYSKNSLLVTSFTEKNALSLTPFTKQTSQGQGNCAVWCNLNSETEYPWRV
jgi:hypothetical protein